ncbi:MAG TPA: patatin-like phospholipase family protein [Rubricoccaceae bacterium]|nr:patatin-like phospholipase family protein [Rubricoccaceae bacterium]
MAEPQQTSPRLGIALGGGAARGWAHLGVLRALGEHGIEPEVVCGTSIGALVGGFYAAGKHAELEAWVAGLTRRDVVELLDFTMAGGGALGGRRLLELFREHVGEVAIEALPRRYAAVATDLHAGSEVWLQRGSLLTAIRASISIPGVFTPVYSGGRWLVDGGLVNPVPVSLCRALGADLVVGVDLHGGPLGSLQPRAEAEPQPAVVPDRPWRAILPWVARAEAGAEAPAPPDVTWVITEAVTIMETRISRSRLAGDPPDLLLIPQVRDVPPLEFSGGRPTIEAGYEVAQRMAPTLRDLLGPDRAP